MNTATQANVLLIDDDTGFLAATSKLLTLLGHNVHTANSIASARKVMATTPKQFDRVLIDLMLPDGSGLELLEHVVEYNDRAMVTIITGHASVKSLIKSLYGPNVNYLIKPITLDDIKSLFDTNKELPSSTNHHRGQFHFGGLIGESDAMKVLYEKIARVSKTKANVMLFGESGVGKEVVANAIHFVSQTSGDIVATNCGAMSKELIGSELFGHEKGAFTGAIDKKKGLFELAHNGTLFLDEITEMPLDMQPNLLRVLETKQVRRLGGATNIDFDCRVISATNRKERGLIQDKILREDLYFRLGVFPIHIPPLRDREEDIPALAHYFLNDLNQQNSGDFVLGEQALEFLGAYSWPGNVRELRHYIHRAFIMTPEDEGELRITTAIESPFHHEVSSSNTISAGRTIEEVERDLIHITLVHTGNDKKQAADLLGISLKTLYNRINANKLDIAK